MKLNIVASHENRLDETMLIDDIMYIFNRKLRKKITDLRQISFGAMVYHDRQN